ncbi:hypothetical protein [Azospirillum sp. TSO22-1]|uniref:hypothetical protein n=1 Tax=Azospirillum sp. TSO22-1 TaxID=716789 RepID=UPI0011B733BD|nr:hypothetical protein [Azospirillum sp. TSO22-1]
MIQYDITSFNTLIKAQFQNSTSLASTAMMQAAASSESRALNMIVSRPSPGGEPVPRHAVAITAYCRQNIDVRNQIAVRVESTGGAPVTQLALERSG